MIVDNMEDVYIDINYGLWIEYIVQDLLVPSKYIVNGSIEWQGERSNDAGTITIKDNCITYEMCQDYRSSGCLKDMQYPKILGG
jgi:hypothetical protein